MNYLWSKYRIWTTSFDSPGEYQGLRITPNVYTTLEEIDTFADAMEEVVKRGSIPGSLLAASSVTVNVRKSSSAAFLRT